MQYKDLLKPTHLKQLCVQHGLTPSRDFGQHYLITDKPVDIMLEAALLNKKATVLEIGPGFGTLTFRLAQAAGHVKAFEIERKLESYWEEQVISHPNIELIWGDALATIPTYIAKHDIPYSVVANLPYQVASRIVRVFLDSSHQPEQMILMVQKEVADRMTAQAGEMNLLALGVQYYAVPTTILKVSPGSFWPAPQVDSAVVHITDIHQKPQADKFFALARAGFSHKRKQLWRNLQTVLSCPPEQTQKSIGQIAHGNSKIRAQDLSLEQWENLVVKLQPYLSTV